MPIVAALAVVVALAAAVSVGQQLGHDAGFLIAFGAVPTLGLVIGLALWLYHRRRSHELIVARYHLKGDALGWRRVRIHALESVRVCAECGAIVPDYRAQEEHSVWHMDLAALLAGEPLDKLAASPWSAITEPSAAVPDPGEPLEPAEQPDSAWRQVRDVFRLRPRPEQLEDQEADQLGQLERTEQLKPEPIAAVPDDPGEWEERARKFRVAMAQKIEDDKAREA